MCETSSNCPCQTAVTNAYRQLVAGGVPDLAAFKTATAVFRSHHPESSVPEARAQISDWLDETAAPSR